MSCSASPAWAALVAHYQDDMAHFNLAQAFASNPQRLAQHSQQAPHVYADLSKNFCTTQTESLLQALAHDCGWQARRDAMLAGEPINTTEGRAAMHWLLRMPRDGGQLRQHPVVQAWPQAQWDTLAAAHDTLNAMLALAEQVRANPHTTHVNLDWDEPSKVVRLQVDQDRARALGISSAELARFLGAQLSGYSASTYREGNELVGIMLRGGASDRDRLEQLGSLAVPTGDGGSVSLSQVAYLRQVFEDGIIWHRDRLPTITVRADLGDGMLPAAVTAQIDPTLDGIRAQLPQGYLLQVGGSVEDAARGQNSIKAGLPLFLLVVTTLLMLQLRSFSRTLMVLVTAPLGLIGATWLLLLFRMPFGFVAMLGVIALMGMIMRNSVILID